MVENKCYDPDCNEEECFNPEHYNYICFDPDCSDEKCMNEKHYNKQLLKDYQKSTDLSVFDHREEIDYDEEIMYAMETWYKAIASRPLQSMASTEDYYLRIVNPKLGENLPSIHLRQVICKYSDPSFFLVLDEGKMKDLGFLSKLPVYFDTPDESSYNDAVVGIIKSLSNIKNLMSHEDEKETH